jgi:uncharacterized protein YukE
MTMIKVDTEALRAASARLKSEGSQMESAIQSADAAINPCRDMQSQRVLRDVEAWDTIKAKFNASLQELLAAADEITQAAIANEVANS